MDKRVPLNWLVDKRSNKGLTQEELADAIGMKRTTYASIEQGYRRASVTNAKIIADYFGFEWPIFFETQLHDSSSCDTKTHC